MRHLALAAALLAASPAFAAGLASRSADDYESGRSYLEGLYAAAGGGGQLMIFTGNNAFGYDLEARLGYSFGPQLQLYLCGALDSSNFPGLTFRSEQVALCVQYHFLVRPAVMVYGRVGIGVSLSSNFVPGSTAAGLMELGGIGVEIRVAPSVFLAPEFFYRYENFAAQGVSDVASVIGFQLALVYY